MIRRLVTALSLLSFLLCGAIVLLWVRSYWVSEGFIYSKNTNLSVGRCVRGQLSITRVYGITKPGSDGFFKWVQWTQLIDQNPSHLVPAYAVGGGFEVRFQFLGFAVAHGTGIYGVSQPLFEVKEFASRLIVIPFWLPCLLFAWPVFPPTVRVLRRIRLHHPVGTCRRCGYDLRANKERCPECGTPILKKPEITV